MPPQWHVARGHAGSGTVTAYLADASALSCMERRTKDPLPTLGETEERRLPALIVTHQWPMATTVGACAFKGLAGQAVTLSVPSPASARPDQRLPGPKKTSLS